MIHEKFYTLGGNQVSFDHVDFDQSQSDVERIYGWEACMYWSSFYNKELSIVPECSVRENDIFVDLGANVGMSSRYAEKIGVKEIYAFEPDPEIFKCLEKNKGEKWKIYNKAISENNGTIQIGKWPEIVEFVDVKAINLNTVFKECELEKIDFLKVDIEGGERSLFNSITDDQLRKIDRIFVEWHHVQGIAYEASQKMREAFMTRFNLAGYNGMVFPGYQDLIYFWRI